MTLGFHQRRRRRRGRWRVFKRALGLALVIAAGAFVYQIGADLAERDVTRLEREIASLSEEIAALQGENADLRAALSAAEREGERWRRRGSSGHPQRLPLRA